MKVKISFSINESALLALLGTTVCAGVAWYIGHSWDLPQTATVPVMATTVISSVISWIAAKRKIL